MNTTLTQFINRVQTATKARSKTINLTIDEAQAIVVEVNKLTARDSTILAQIENLINNANSVNPLSSDKNNVSQHITFLDGGRFGDESN